MLIWASRASKWKLSKDLYQKHFESRVAPSVGPGKHFNSEGEKRFWATITYFLFKELFITLANRSILVFLQHIHLFKITFCKNLLEFLLIKSPFTLFPRLLWPRSQALKTSFCSIKSLHLTFFSRFFIFLSRIDRFYMFWKSSKHCPYFYLRLSFYFCSITVFINSFWLLSLRF